MARPLRDLRISVTGRCQFRCTCCMPREVFGRDFAFLPHGELLTFEELARLAQIFASLGVRKLRLTGIGGVQDIALTTNGALLAARTRPWRRRACAGSR